MSFFISDAFAEGVDLASPDALTGLLPLVLFGVVLYRRGRFGLAGCLDRAVAAGLFGVVLYFLMIRPQVKRQKEHKKMVETLGKGDEVGTAGGIVGKITKMGDNFITVEIAEGVEVKFRRAAVESVMPKGSLKDM